jgi:hypothetical protein
MKGIVTARGETEIKRSGGMQIVARLYQLGSMMLGKLGTPGKVPLTYPVYKVSCYYSILVLMESNPKKSEIFPVR